MHCLKDVAVQRKKESLFEEQISLGNAFPAVKNKFSSLQFPVIQNEIPCFSLDQKEFIPGPAYNCYAPVNVKGNNDRKKTLCNNLEWNRHSTRTRTKQKTTIEMKCLQDGNEISIMKIFFTIFHIFCCQICKLIFKSKLTRDPWLTR